eukprot:403341888
MGIAIIVLSAKIKEADLFDSADDSVKRTGRSAFYLMVIFACFALGVAALGFITAKWHKWWLVGCYSFWSFSIAVIYLAAAIVLFAVVGYADTLMKDYCKDQKISVYGSKRISESFNEIDRTAVIYSSKYMCTPQCPCSSNLNLTLWSEPRLNEFNRTKGVNGTSGRMNFTLTTNQSNAYTNFMECYDDILDLQANNKPTLIFEKLDNIGDSVVSFLKNLEEDFMCNGICKPGLFWLFRDTNIHPPTSNCQEGIKDYFEEYANSIAGALIVSFVITGAAFGVNYGLWRKGVSDKK